MCWSAGFPVISTVRPDESGSSRACCWREEYFIVARGSITTLADVWSCEPHVLWLTFTEKVALMCRVRVRPNPKPHLAPDPTEGETPTWIFPLKSINIACNRWHSPLLSTDTRFELRTSISILETMITSEAVRNAGFIPNNASDQSSQWPRALAPTQKELLRFSRAWPVLVISFYWTLRTPPSC